MVALGRFYDKRYGWVTIYERPEDIPDDQARAGGYFGVLYPTNILSRIGSKQVFETHSPMAASSIVGLILFAAVVVVVSVSIVHVLTSVVTVIKAGQARVVGENPDGSKIIRADDESLILFHPDGSYDVISGPPESDIEGIIWAGAAAGSIVLGLYATGKYLVPALKSGGKEGAELAKKAAPKAKAAYAKAKKYYQARREKVTTS